MALRLLPAGADAHCAGSQLPVDMFAGRRADPPVHERETAPGTLDVLRKAGDGLLNARCGV